MGQLAELVNACHTQEAQLREARQAVTESRRALFTVLAPLAARHEKEIGGLFEEFGHRDLYRERFGEIYGTVLESVYMPNGRIVECTFGYSFRGEPQESIFLLPRRYLDGNPEQQLEADLTHYQNVLKRWAKAQEKRSARLQREANLAEFTRLSQLLGATTRSAVQ
jgi:hypothetical protein